MNTFHSFGMEVMAENLAKTSLDKYADEDKEGILATQLINLLIERSEHHNKLIRNKEQLTKNKKILKCLKDQIKKSKEEVEFVSKEDRGKCLAVLYEKEEKIELIVSELDECIDNDKVELEEFYEKLDTLAELHEMEKKIDLRSEFEKEILQYKHKIRKLNELLKLKDNLINSHIIN